MYSKYGGKLKRWLTRGRIAALVIALVGLGLLVGGTTGTLASRETGTEQADAANLSAKPEPTVEKAAGKDDTPAPQSHAPTAKAATPSPTTTAPPATRIALAPRPDRDRPARRLAELVKATPPNGKATSNHVTAENTGAAWQRFAATSPVANGLMIAIVIDDAGHDIARTKRLAGFRDGVLTMAFLPYVEQLDAQTEIARAGGHEILLHLPMEPLNPEVDTGPNVLNIDLLPSELDARLHWNLARFEGYVGINNHMGSRFTADRPAMAHLMKALHDRGLLFLDSRTTSATVGRETASAADVPFLQRDVFLDNESTEAHVAAQLAETEEVARRQGYAIAIGHPHEWTISALEAWAPGARDRGFVLVPLTAVKRHQQQHVAQGPIHKRKESQ